MELFVLLKDDTFGETNVSHTKYITIKMLLDDFTVEEKTAWETIVVIKKFDITNIKDMAKFIVLFVSQSQGKCQHLKHELRKKILDYTNIFEADEIASFLDRKINVNIDIRNKIEPNLKEIWKVYHYFCKEDVDDFSTMMEGI